GGERAAVTPCATGAAPTCPRMLGPGSGSSSIPLLSYVCIPQELCPTAHQSGSTTNATTARQRCSGPWASCCATCSWGSTRSGGARRSSGTRSCSQHSSLKVDPHLWAQGEYQY
ncbi:unnamed protein product, partial [Coccothraustes coccothraustes]